MSLLSALEICHLIQERVVERTDESYVNAASLDLTLGNKLFIEEESDRYRTVSLKDKQQLAMREVDISDKPYILAPGEFVLAHTREVFNLPDWLSAEYKLKSSMARIGLEHLNAGWCDAGWHGSVLTLELINVTRHHYIQLDAGVRIGQIVFFRHLEVPRDHSYAVKGRYNKDASVSQVKKDPRREVKDWYDERHNKRDTGS